MVDVRALTESVGRNAGKRKKRDKKANAPVHAQEGHNAVIQHIAGDEPDRGRFEGDITSLNPDECWHDPRSHDRILENLEADPEYQELLGLIEEFGQQEAGRVTTAPNPDNPKQRYKIISGARRWVVAKELGRPFLAHVGNLSPEQFLVAMYLENSGRSGISAYETARNMICAIEDGVLKNATAYGERFGIPKSTCYKYQAIGALPKSIFPASVQLNKLTLRLLNDFCIALSKLDSDSDKQEIYKGLESFDLGSGDATKAYTKEIRRLTKSISLSEEDSPAVAETVTYKLKGTATAAKVVLDDKKGSVSIKGGIKDNEALRSALTELLEML